jgi:hypothetical protein
VVVPAARYSRLVEIEPEFDVQLMTKEEVDNICGELTKGSAQGGGFKLNNLLLLQALVIPLMQFLRT